MLTARRIHITGIVQGVGYRPFVWHLAHPLGLVGWVCNGVGGVDMVVQGTALQVDGLVRRLSTEAPAQARVDSVQVTTAALLPDTWIGFSIIDRPPDAFDVPIVPDTSTPLTTTAIGPDMGVCADCLHELFDPTGRRWRHALITCTHCGPRYTVTHALPYDRRQTSMAAFDLCPACLAEYTTPSDRRFHAETTCCPLCGPQLALVNSQACVVAGDPLAAAWQLLQTGGILAIKGLGGFHLACDARCPDAVARLRQSKNREVKPLAVMLANIPSIAPYAHVSLAEQTLLQGCERPIVLLRTRTDCDHLLQGVAPDLRHLGVMLPSTPLQYLLWHEAAGRPAGTGWLNQAQDAVLVMTSANPFGSPIVGNLADALSALAGMADAVLDHNRDIVARCDDSVLRRMAHGVQYLRRSRGYAPAAIRLPQSGPQVLAFGSYLKNTVCLTRGTQAFLSPHIGDLDNAATCGFLDETVQHMTHLLSVRPEIVAHDLQPDSYATRAALSFADQHGLPTVAVQHHHAHIAAVCAEHGLQHPVLGLALDGAGLGTDGTVWGGELLRVHGAQFERLGALRPLPMPGGDRAAREPWRMAAAALHQLGRSAEITQRFNDPGAATVAAMLARQFNSPMTTSMGRVFDAAAGLLGICHRMQYEAEAAVLLEQAAVCQVEQHGWPLPVIGGWQFEDGQLDVCPALAALIDDPDPGLAAARFHATLIHALGDWVKQAADTTGLTTVVCGGGCFLNTLLSQRLRHHLVQRGFNVLMPQRAPSGDGGLALGQAWVAMQSVVSSGRT